MNNNIFLLLCSGMLPMDDREDKPARWRRIMLRESPPFAYGELPWSFRKGIGILLFVVQVYATQFLLKSSPPIRTILTSPPPIPVTILASVILLIVQIMFLFSLSFGRSMVVEEDAGPKGDEEADNQTVPSSQSESPNSEVGNPLSLSEAYMIADIVESRLVPQNRGSTVKEEAVRELAERVGELEKKHPDNSLDEVYSEVSKIRENSVSNLEFHQSIDELEDSVDDNKKHIANIHHNLNSNVEGYTLGGSDSDGDQETKQTTKSEVDQPEDNADTDKEVEKE